VLAFLLLLSLDYGYNWLAVLLLFLLSFFSLFLFLFLHLSGLHRVWYSTDFSFARWATLGVVFNFWLKTTPWFGILMQGGYSISSYALGFAAV
jgi:hypothetical protein